MGILSSPGYRTNANPESSDWKEPRHRMISKYIIGSLLAMCLAGDVFTLFMIYKGKTVIVHEVQKLTVVSEAAIPDVCRDYTSTEYNTKCNHPNHELTAQNNEGYYHFFCKCKR